ncbi:uncharacterized protein A4U43_C01F12660 [Asparagus officinalis]|uniref:DUF4005 domain-containing protein n=1 Tax=Asparagus officinalis TaxID=4686 RepID=A0A5P1FP38_ASPOF|nr:uncharacterized protein A4U43_C01F12660 [Asparagus officinalis]
MGKKGGSSWLTAVKRAFRSPSKDRDDDEKARRALRALKGLVKLQALVRGHNVRKQAKITLQYMQALIRVQASVRDQRLRLSQDGSTKSSVIINCGTLLKDSRDKQEIAERRSMSNFVNDWDERSQTMEEIQALPQSRKNDASKREGALSHVFSQKTMRSSRNHFHPLEEDQELEAVAVEQTAPRRMSSRSSFDIRRSSSRSRASTDNQDPIKTLETETAGWPYSYSTPTTTNRRHSHYYSPVTPSPSKPRPVQVRSSSPRCNTPSVAAFYNYTGDGVTRHQQETIPNYMAATESARARARSNSAPRQRPGTPEIDSAGSVKDMRLSFPCTERRGRYHSRII